MNILIYGAEFVNKGAEAMLRTVQQELGRRLPDCSLYLNVSPEYADLAKVKGLHPLPSHNLSPIHKAWSIGVVCCMRFLGMNLAAAKTLGVGPKFAELAGMRAVINISGFAIGDDWGQRAAQAHVRFARYIRAFGVAIVYMPQSWGSFEDPHTARAARQLLQLVSLSFARDQSSLNHLKCLKGYPESKIDRAADIAFLFQADPPERGRELLESLSPALGRKPLIGIVPNMRIYERASQQGLSNRYIDLLETTVHHCLDALGCDVVLMPHEIKTHADHIPDDRFLCDLVHRRVNRAESAFCMLADYSAEELKSVIGRCDLVIGSRFHSLVAALSQCVPALALGWSHKYSELMHEVGLGEYTIEFSDFEMDRWLSMLDQAWSSREQSRAVLARHVPDLQASASRAFDRAVAVIAGYKR